jgi:drug/metabolite transporter (DMT)-like permease
MNQNLLYGIVLLSAVGHAVWNALLKNATDRLIMMIAIRIVGLLYGLIVLSVVEWPATASLPWLLAAALAMWIYQGLLIKGYQVGDLSFVYPLARGIAPVLLTGLAFLSIGEKITSQQLLGVISISFGIATLAFLGQGGRSSLVYAALTGASIATYSLLSGVGVRSSGNLLGFSAALEAATGLGMLIYATSTRGRSIVPSLLAIWPTGLGAGAISVGGYLAFLVAVSYLPIGPVSAIRECSALFGVLIGVFVINERFGVVRAVGAFLMTGGIVLLSLF